MTSGVAGRAQAVQVNGAHTPSGGCPFSPAVRRQVIDPVSLHVDYHGLISYCAPGTLAQHESESIRPRRREELFLHTTTRSRA